MNKVVEDYYKQCIEILLLNLRIKNVDHFLENLTKENCAKLGAAYYTAAISAQIKAGDKIELGAKNHPNQPDDI